jgi:AraC-like DNA-binding protein
MSRCYTQITLADRRRLHHLVAAKVPVNEMARQLGRHRSTIYREIKRNTFRDRELSDYDGYYSTVADDISIHVHGEERLMALVRMINEETRADRAAREIVLHRLLEVLFIDAIRSAASAKAPPGLLRGMADPLLAPTLRRIHANPGRSITVETLAQEAAMSRSTFFDRFRKEVGVAPMEYATRWRMALAKELLRDEVAMAEIAERVGYGSTSAFNVAFSRHVGMPPGAYSRAIAAT